jgi:hypothetical protein
MSFSIFVFFIIYIQLKPSLILSTFADESFDGSMTDHSTPEVTRVITTNSESNFQRKITVSQTQL